MPRRESIVLQQNDEQLNELQRNLANTSDLLADLEGLLLSSQSFTQRIPVSVLLSEESKRLPPPPSPPPTPHPQQHQQPQQPVPKSRFISAVKRVLKNRTVMPTTKVNI